MAVVGMRGMGKSYIVKQLLQNTHPDSRLIYDPNIEYTDLYNKPLLKFEQFAQTVPRVSNAVIVVEEATIFLNNRGYDSDFVEAVVRARHTNNTIILVFHSLQDLPKYLFRLMNFIILLKTHDTADYVDKQFRNKTFSASFVEIQNADFLYNENGVKYSPNKIIDIFNNG